MRGPPTTPSSWARALYRISDGTWEVFVNTDESRGFFLGQFSGFLPQEKLTGWVRINSWENNGPSYTACESERVIVLYRSQDQFTGRTTIVGSTALIWILGHIAAPQQKKLYIVRLNIDFFSPVLVNKLLLAVIERREKMVWNRK